VAEVVSRDGYRFELHVSPNRAAVPNSFSVRIIRGGAPVRGAEVVSGITMLDMGMGSRSYALTETSPGVYSRSVPALVMVGRWALSFEVTPPGKAPFRVLLVDRANG